VNVCGWLDVNDNGTYEAGEGTCQTTSLVNPTLTFIWNTIDPNTNMDTFARFRVTSDSMGTADVGLTVSDGEAEEYAVSLQPTLAVIDNFRVDLITAADLVALLGSGRDVDNSPDNGENPLSDTTSDYHPDEILAGLSPDDAIAVVRWDTVQEQGTIGFYVERKAEGDNWQRLNSSSMLPGLITAPLGGEYLLLDPEVHAGESYQYRLVEKEVWGSEHRYGPWQVVIGGEKAPPEQPVAERAASPARSSSILKQAKTEENSSSTRADNWSSWRSLEQGYAGRARQAAPPAATGVDTTAFRLLPSTGMETMATTAFKRRIKRVRLRTNEAGMYAFSLDELSAVTGIRSKRLGRKLLHGNWSFSSDDGPAAYYYDLDQQLFVFAADPFISTDSVENVYQLGRFRHRQGWNMDLVTGDGPAAGIADQFRDSITFAEENWLLTWVHQEEESDYGYWDYVYAPYKSSVELEIELPDPAAASAEQGLLTIVLRGAGDTVDGNDHLARASLNGIPLIGAVEWEGSDQAVLELPFDQTLLGGTEAGETVTATVTVEGEVINGAAYNLFYVESVTVGYDRKMYAMNDQLRLENTPAGPVTVAGFTNPDIRVIEAPNTAEALWREDITVTQDSMGYSVSFDSIGEDYQLSAAPLRPGLEADYNGHLRRRWNRADYLIIAPRSLEQTAEQLAQYRSDRFTTRIVWLQDIYDDFSHGRVDSAAISAFLSHVSNKWRLVPEYVVLLGRGTLDHPDRKGYGESLIPLRMAATPWGLIGSDNRYADVDGDHIPDFTLGRIAVSSDADGIAYVNKLKAYEAAAAGTWTGNAAVVADDPDPDAGDFHANSDETATLLQGYGMTIEKLYHADDTVRDSLLSNWSAGNYGLVNYDGHGGRINLGSNSENFLNVADVAGLGNGTQLPVFAALSCAVGDSSYPGTLSLGDSLTLQADGGSIASYVPTGLSLDNSAHQLNIAFINALLGDGVTVGNAARNALIEVGSQGMETFMFDTYTLSGDPAVEMK
jgi:hypothetical protein